MQLHTNRNLLIALLVPFTVTFVILFWMTLQEGVNPVARFFDLLQHDRIVQLIMFDFTFFFLWVFFWMVDEGRRTGRAVFAWLLVGMVCATWMIYLFVATRPRHPDSDRKG